MEWYELKNAEEVDSPALLVYPERVRQNISQALAMCRQGALRPHVKTHKIPEVCRMMQEAGIRKFKCATLAEAEMLAMAGAEDILLAYQPTEVKARRFAALAAAFPRQRFSCLVDNVKSAVSLSRVFREGFAGEAAVYIDLNVGMNRTGILPENALELYQACNALAHLKVIGLHAYDGHLTDPDPVERRRQADQVYEIVSALKQSIETSGAPPLQLVLGGSPSFPLHAKREGVELSPGTFVFWDEGYSRLLPELPFECAAILLTRVISRPGAHTLCLDLGHKSVAAENPLPLRVIFPGEPGAKILSQSEEHLVVQVPDAGRYEVGDLWYAIPYHICPTVALYETVHVVRDGFYTEQWEVLARKRRILR